jgi:hypothetical protein
MKAKEAATADEADTCDRNGAAIAATRAVDKSDTFQRLDEPHDFQS